LAIHVFEFASLVTSWIFLHKRRYIPVCACLMILSVVPSVAAIWFLAGTLLWRS
jgi:hypothetical protein